MHAQGLIGTSWADGPTDGLGAMVGAWSAAAEARRGGVALGQVELMREIERYNEVDCRVMAEVIGFVSGKPNASADERVLRTHPIHRHRRID